MAALRSRSPAVQPGQGLPGPGAGSAAADRPTGVADLTLRVSPAAPPARHRRAGSWGLRAAFIPPLRGRAPPWPPAAPRPAQTTAALQEFNDLLMAFSTKTLSVLVHTTNNMQGGQTFGKTRTLFLRGLWHR